MEYTYVYKIDMPRNPDGKRCSSTYHMHLNTQGVHLAGLLDVQNILSADTGNSWQTDGHSFGDHLISGSVGVASWSVIKLLLCSVVCLYDSCEKTMSNQPAR
jgi:hypothetical protein